MMLAATVAFPASGSYTYEIDASNGARYTTTITIASTAAGLTTHETFGVPAIATTDQQFDGNLHERSFSATQVSSGNSISIVFSNSTATYHVGGKTLEASLDDADCVLVEDNVLTSAIMLPAVLQTEPEKCVFVFSTSVAAVSADLISAALTHSPHAAAGDAYVMAQIGKIVETIWYDPATLIPDYIDFGDAGSAKLTSSTPAPAKLSPTSSRTKSRAVSVWALQPMLSWLPTYGKL